MDRPGISERGGGQPSPPSPLAVRSANMYSFMENNGSYEATWPVVVPTLNILVKEKIMLELKCAI